MKLTIGENIRNFRKKNDLTQEALADRLGVTYQSISRWENGTTYPDLELIPAIAEVLAVTVDELLGMPQIEKEKRAVQTFDELRRECIKREYDAEKIVELFKDAPGQYSVVPKSAKSACKRVCMFLRWMVRDNSCVDLGLWSSFIPKESLIIPLDTHVLKQAKLFGLISSKASSMSLALNLTKKLKKAFPLDPLKADFALFGNGIDKSSE